MKVQEPVSSGSHRMKPQYVAASPARRNGAAVALVALVAFRVGTGGDATPNYFAERANKGYPFERMDFARAVEVPVSPLSFADELAQLRKVLPTSVSALASVFNVSRQTIYDWQNGAAASDASLNRLRDLTDAASRLIEAHIDVSARLLNRPISNGQSLLEVSRLGGSAVAAATELAKLVLKERSERDAISARLAGRNKTADTSDFGAPFYSGELG